VTGLDKVFFRTAVALLGRRDHSGRRFDMAVLGVWLPLQRSRRIRSKVLIGQQNAGKYSHSSTAFCKEFAGPAKSSLDVSIQEF
jgi:hypothetical protein